MTLRSFILSLRPLFSACLAVSLGLLAGSLLALVAGEDPLKVIQVMVQGAFGTAHDRGMVLYFTTILICTGLAVAIPFQAGVFNIGAEGQTLMGAFACALTALHLPADVSPMFGIGLSVTLAVLCAGLWGGIAGAIRAFRGGHEVIGSIMLNFIAAGLTGWLVVGAFQSSDSQNPETALIADHLKLSRWTSFDGSPATSALMWSLSCAFMFWVVMQKTRVGLWLKTVNQSPDAAYVAGYRVALIRFWVFFMGSAVCGLAGAAMVLGESGRFRLDMSEGFGFLGIPVALLGRGRPLGVVFSAFLFAALHHGASALDIEATKVTRDLAQVIAAIVVLFVVAQHRYSETRGSAA